MKRDMDEKAIIVPDQDVFNVELTLSDGAYILKMGKLNYRDSLVDSQTGTMQSRAEFTILIQYWFPEPVCRVTIERLFDPILSLCPACGAAESSRTLCLYSKRGRQGRTAKLRQAKDRGITDY